VIAMPLAQTSPHEAVIFLTNGTRGNNRFVSSTAVPLAQDC
jgi:hypothetical protein